MDAVIVNYRMAKHHQTTNQMVLKVKGVSTKEKALQLVGKMVSWETPTKKTISGKIMNIHGNSGAVRVFFEKGMPGQSVGTKVSVQ